MLTYQTTKCIGFLKQTSLQKQKTIKTVCYFFEIAKNNLLLNQGFCGVGTFPNS